MSERRAKRETEVEKERRWQKKTEDRKVALTALRLLLTIPHLYI